MSPDNTSATIANSACPRSCRKKGMLSRMLERWPTGASNVAGQACRGTGSACLWHDFPTLGRGGGLAAQHPHDNHVVPLACRIGMAAEHAFPAKADPLVEADGTLVECR